MRCFLHIDQFDWRRPFKPWLYTIARRLLARMQPSSHAARTCDNVRCTTGGPEEHLIAIETRDSLWRKVRQVTTGDQFQLIWFRYADRLSIADIAEIFDDTESACKMRLSRLRSRLRPHLAPFVEVDCDNHFQILTQRRAAS